MISLYLKYFFLIFSVTVIKKSVEQMMIKLMPPGLIRENEPGNTSHKRSWTINQNIKTVMWPSVISKSQEVYFFLWRITEIFHPAEHTLQMSEHTCLVHTHRLHPQKWNAKMIIHTTIMLLLILIVVYIWHNICSVLWKLYIVGSHWRVRVTADSSSKLGSHRQTLLGLALKQTEGMVCHGI